MFSIAALFMKIQDILAPGRQTSEQEQIRESENDVKTGNFENGFRKISTPSQDDVKDTDIGSKLEHEHVEFSSNLTREDVKDVDIYSNLTREDVKDVDIYSNLTREDVKDVDISSKLTLEDVKSQDLNPLLSSRTECDQISVTRADQDSISAPNDRNHEETIDLELSVCTEGVDGLNINLINDKETPDSICSRSSESGCSNVSMGGDCALFPSDFTNDCGRKGSIDSLEQERVNITSENTSRYSSPVEYQLSSDDSFFDLEEITHSEQNINIKLELSSSESLNVKDETEAHTSEITGDNYLNSIALYSSENITDDMASCDTFGVQQNENIDDLAANVLDYERGISQSKIFSDLDKSKSNSIASEAIQDDIQENIVLEQNLSVYNDGLNQFFLFDGQTNDDSYVLQQNVKCFLNGLEKIEGSDMFSAQNAPVFREIKEIEHLKAVSNQEIPQAEAESITSLKEDDCEKAKLLILQQNIFEYENALQQYQQKLLFSDGPCHIYNSLDTTSENILKRNIKEYETELQKYLTENRLHTTSDSILQQNINDYEKALRKYMNKSAMDVTPGILLKQNIKDYETELIKYMNENNIGAESSSRNITNNTTKDYDSEVEKYNNIIVNDVTSEIILQENIKDYETEVNNYMNRSTLGDETYNTTTENNIQSQCTVLQQNLHDYSSQIDAWFNNNNSNATITTEGSSEITEIKPEHRSFVSKTADEVVAEAKLICDRILMEYNFENNILQDDAKVTDKLYHQNCTLSKDSLSTGEKQKISYKICELLEPSDKTSNDSQQFISKETNSLEKEVSHVLTDVPEASQNDPRGTSKFEDHFKKPESKDESEDDDIFKVLEMTDEHEYSEDLCSPKSSPKLMRLIQTLALGGYYEEDYGNSDEDEENKEEKCASFAHSGENYQIFEGNDMNLSTNPTDKLNLNSELTATVSTNIKNQIDLKNITTNDIFLQQNTADYEKEINSWFHFNNSENATISDKYHITTVPPLKLRDIASKTVDDVITEAKIVCNHISAENVVEATSLPQDDMHCNKILREEISNHSGPHIHDTEHSTGHIRDSKLRVSFSQSEAKEETEDDDIFRVLEMADEVEYNEDLCSPKSSPKLLRLIQSLALGSHFEGDSDISDDDGDADITREDKTCNNITRSAINLQKFADNNISLCADTCDQLSSKKNKIEEVTTFSVLKRDKTTENNIHPLDTCPHPPPRKKKSLSIACLRSEIAKEEMSLLASNGVNKSNHIFDKTNLIVPPPRKNRKKNNKLPMSYSMSDVSDIDFDLNLLANMKSARTGTISGSNIGEHYDSSKEDSKHEIHFAAPEVSASLVEYNVYSPRRQNQRASIVLLDDIDYANRADREFVARKTPHVKKKSYTFTSSDVYLQEAREKVNLKRSKSSVSKIIRKTFSFKKVGNSGDPPCMPNLVKRYIRVRRNKKRKKSKGLDVIPEEQSSPKLTKTESFASIFMGSSSENLDSENLGSYVSNSFPSFPEDSSPNIHRSLSNFDLLRQLNPGSNSSQPCRMKRSSSFIQLTANPKSFVKRLVTEDSTVSLNAEAIRRAKELLYKSIELGCKENTKNKSPKVQKITSGSEKISESSKYASHGLEIPKFSSLNKSGITLKNGTINVAPAIMSKKFIKNSFSSLSHLSSVTSVPNEQSYNSKNILYDEKRFKAPLSLLKLKKENAYSSSKDNSAESLNVIHERNQIDNIITHSFKIPFAKSTQGKSSIVEESKPDGRVVYSFPYAAEMRMNKNIETLENKLAMGTSCEQYESSKVSVDKKNTNAMSNCDNVEAIFNNTYCRDQQINSVILQTDLVTLNQTEKEKAKDILNSLEVLKEINNKIQGLHKKMQQNSEELVLATQKREIVSSEAHQPAFTNENNGNADSDLRYKYEKESIKNSEIIIENGANLESTCKNDSLIHNIVDDTQYQTIMEDNKISGTDYINHNKVDVTNTLTTSNEVAANNAESVVDNLPQSYENITDVLSNNFMPDHCSKAINPITEKENIYSTKKLDRQLFSEIDTDANITSNSVENGIEPLSDSVDIQNLISKEFDCSFKSNDDPTKISDDGIIASEFRLPVRLSDGNELSSDTDTQLIPVVSLKDTTAQNDEYKIETIEVHSLPLLDDCDIKMKHKEDVHRTISLPSTKLSTRKFIRFSSPFSERKFTVTWPVDIDKKRYAVDVNEGHMFDHKNVTLIGNDSISMDGRLNNNNELSENDFLPLPAAKSLPEIILRTWAERQDSIEAILTGKKSWQSDTPGQPIVEVNPLMQDNTSTLSRKEEDRTQKDRCVEVYPETIRQRQRNMAPSPSKVDIKNWEITDVTDAPKDKKLLPSVKALRNQFENGGRESSPSPTGNSMAGRSSATSSTSSLSMPSLDVTSSHASLNSAQTVSEYAESVDIEAPVEPIYRQFQNVDQDFKDVTSKPPSTIGWNPQPLLNKLYQLQPITKISSSKDSAFIDIEGYLEKLPCGRKKSTFWNAWKRRYFCAKKGVLYCYHNNQMDKLSMKLPLLGGKVEIMDPNLVSVEDGKTEAISSGMIGIDDGKGHYVVVRCASRNEAERWKTAIESHVIDDFESQYVQPWPMPMNPSLLRDTIVIDIGSCSVRAGVLASQATLPQLFFPSVVATNRETQRQIWGTEALLPEVRSISNINFPIKPSHKISKFSVDLNALSSLLQKTFADLNVDQKCYNVQLSVPRVLNPNTQTELMKMLFDQFGVKGVNLTHQSILALYAYNATSGIVVDIGERIDVVPIIDGYIVDGGVSRVPYGGYRILEHLRHYLFQKNLSLLNETESYIIRAVLEMICYCSQHYNTEKARCAKSPENFEKYAPLSDFFPNTTQFEAFHDISLNFGRFQATEGIFNPDAWGLDHPGLHKLVHKAIQECSMDIRKEMSKSIFLAGGVSQLPGLSERLRTELDNLTPPAVRPKVHCSPYRYHASYIGACVLAESDAFSQSKISREDWLKQGNSSLRKWAL